MIVAHPICRQFAQASPKISVAQAFRVSHERAHQPAGAFALMTGFAGRVRTSQETSRATPSSPRTLKLILVNFGAAFEFLDLPMTFRYGFAYRMQAIGGKRQRNMLALVAGQQQPHVHIMIEIVGPGFVKSFFHQW